MQDLVFWILAGISLISLICAIIFACACRRRPKEKKISSELISISEVAIFPEAAPDVKEDLTDMELTVVQPLRQPEVSSADFMQAAPSATPGREEACSPATAKKTIPAKPKKRTDMDVINELLEKLK